MKIRFVHSSPIVGGLALAVERLALALTERGHSCDVLVPAAYHTSRTGEVPQIASPLIPATGRVEASRELTRVLADGHPDLLIIGEGQLGLLEAAASAAPTLLHSQMHWAVCPDAGRYWNRLGQECRVRAGWKCAALRPILGCSGRQRAFSLKYVTDQQRLVELLASGTVGSIAISGRQVEMLLDHGVPRDSIAVIPNLGMRMTAEELERAAATTPPEDRSVIAFFGRLSKEKGVQLLPGLDKHLPEGKLRLYGEGYLEKSLELGTALGGGVSQERVAGILQWARGTVFPSLWPEPGGIVGIDAQLFACPLAAFGLGAALDWPHAALFEPGDIDGMGRWATARAPVGEARCPETIAARQALYWTRVSSEASGLLEHFMTSHRFPVVNDGAVKRCLELATAGEARGDKRARP